MRKNTIPHFKKSVKRKKESKTQQNLEILQIIMFSYNITIPDSTVISFFFLNLFIKSLDEVTIMPTEEAFWNMI